MGVLINDAFLGKITENLGNVYFPLGLLLNVARAYIERLENDFPKNTWRVTFEVLVKWRETSKMRPRTDKLIEELVKALSDLGLNDVVEIVKQEQSRLAREELRQSKEELEKQILRNEVRRLQDVLNTKVQVDNDTVYIYVVVVNPSAASGSIDTPMDIDS